MRCLVKATMPVEAGNALVQDPNFSKRLESILGDLKPEAVYFAIERGQRTIYLIVNAVSGADLPAIGEPLWLSLHADVEIIPLMDRADMAKATPSILQAAKKYGSPAPTTVATGPSRRTRVLVGRGA